MADFFKTARPIGVIFESFVPVIFVHFFLRDVAFKTLRQSGDIVDNISTLN